MRKVRFQRCVEPETTVLGVPAEIVGHPSDEAVPQPPPTSVEMGPAKDLSALEARVRKAFEDVLARKDIAGNGNFFDNGGTSALLLTLGSRLHQELDVRVSAVDLFRYPSIQKLVQYLGSQLPAASPALSAGPNRADLRHRRLDARKRAQDPLHHGESFRGPVVGEHENDRTWHSA